MSAVVWGLLAVPAAGGAVLTGAGLRSARTGSERATAADRLAPVLAVVVAGVTLALAVLAAVRRSSATAPLLAGIPAEFTVDGLGAAMVVMVAAITLAVLLFAGHEFEPRQPRARFCGFILIFATAMLVTVTASNLAVLLMGWEVMGAMSYALIAFHWRGSETVPAAGTAFLTTRAADLGLYLAAGAALAGTGGLGFAALSGAGQPWLALATAGVIAAAVGKSAQFPLSFWLSAAMRGPSGVSALLHSATMVAAGGYLLLRLQPVLVASGFGAPLVAWLGVGTAVLLGAVAVVQPDLKQLLAASTSAQIGFVVLAAGVAAVVGGAAQLVVHAAVKSLLFLAAGAWLVALGTKQLPELHGVARRHPVVGVSFTIGALTLAGAPPLALWATKDLVLAGAKHEAMALYLAGLVAAALSALYAGRALALVWLPAGMRGGEPGRRPAGPAARLPLVLLAAVSLGLAPLALPQAQRLLGAHPEPTPAELAASAGLGLATLAVAWWWAATRPVPAPRSLLHWLYLAAGARLLVVRPGMAVAEGLARFDDRMLSRAVDGAAVGVLALAGQVRDRAETGVDGAVAGVVAAARVLGRLARRPQTGQLHTYYAQTVVALLGVAVTFVLVLLWTR